MVANIISLLALFGYAASLLLQIYAFKKQIVANPYLWLTILVYVTLIFLSARNFNRKLEKPNHKRLLYAILLLIGVFILFFIITLLLNVIGLTMMVEPGPIIQ